MSCDLSRLFLAQNSIWQNGTTFHYFLEVAVIVIVMRLIGIAFLWRGLLRYPPRQIFMFSDLIYFKPNCSLCHLIFKKKVFFRIQRRVNAPEGCKVLHLNRKSAPLTEEGSGLVTRCSCCARNIIQRFHQKEKERDEIPRKPFDEGTGH